jgi:prophage regulatory protein
MTATNMSNHQIVRLKGVKALVCLGRSTIYAKLDVNSPSYDESFPLPIRLGGSGPGGPIGWRVDQINSWILSRPLALQVQELDQPAEVAPKKRATAKSGRTYVGRGRPLRDTTA